MAEPFVTIHCEPCEDCVRQEWQTVEHGRLRWYTGEYCPRYAVQACGRGWGVPPDHVRDRIVEREGTVRVPIGGPDGVPLKAAREILGLTIAELNRVRVHGYEATPVEAALLESRRTPGA
ncbi:hypothetical protein [Streptomyces sp. NPDC089799]|uniref:hypothetical protein n=1 Tax=Streptomyces sp. NPDC089799 TaxID=3155066 RepID=UPI003449127F